MGRANTPRDGPRVSHAARVVTVVLGFIRPVRERLVALLPPFRRGLALAASLPLAATGTRAALGTAQSIGVGVVKLVLVVIAADILLGLAPWQSRADLRRNLRGAVAGGLLGIAFAAAAVGTALDPGPTPSAVAPASATPATSPAVAAHDVPVAPESEDFDPARPAERRSGAPSGTAKLT